MASGEWDCHVRCPACGEEIALEARLRTDMKRMVLGIDLDPVHAHVAERHPEADG